MNSSRMIYTPYLSLIQHVYRPRLWTIRNFTAALNNTRIILVRTVQNTEDAVKTNSYSLV